MRSRFLLPAVVGLATAGLTFSLFNLAKTRAPEASPVVSAHASQASQTQARVDRPRIETETDPARRGRMLRDWTETITLDQIGAALVQLEQESDPELRAELRRELLASWARRDLAGLATWCEARDRADALHQDALHALVAVLVAQDARRGFQQLEESIAAGIRHELYGPFFREWANTEPAAAAEALVQRIATGSEVAVWSDLLGQVVARWSHVDLDRAVAWTTSLPDGAEKNRALVQLGYQWAERSPAAAAAYASIRNDPALMRLVAGKWAEADPRTALAWAIDLPAGDSRTDAVAGAATAWAQKDPAAAALYVDGLVAPSGGSQATLAVVSAWSQADPEKAALWVARFPEGAVRESALEQVVGSWAANDTAAAAQWLRQLPDTRSRDVAIGAFCAALTPRDPAQAFEWARRISDETLRTQTMENAAVAWDEMKTKGML